MSTTSKTRALVAAVIFLLLTNIAVLVFFLCCKGPGRKQFHGGRDGVMKEFLQKEVGFSASQISLYDSLSKKNRENIRKRFDDMRNIKMEQFKQLGRNGFSDTAMSKAASESAEMQGKMELNLIMQIDDIRKLCTPDQLPKFDSGFYKIWNKHDIKKNKPEEKK